MKTFPRILAAALFAAALSGCCYSQGYYDPATGTCYGGGWQPCAPPCFSHLFGDLTCGPGGCCWSAPHNCLTDWGCHSHHCGGGCSCGSTCAPGPSGCCPSCGGTPYSVSPGTTIYTESMPSVPAGVYENPTGGPSVPTPNDTPMDQSTFLPPTISSAEVPPPLAAPIQREARNEKWIPARP